MATTLRLTDGTVSQSQNGGYVVESITSGRRYVALPSDRGDLELYALESIESAGDDDRENSNRRSTFLAALARNGSLAYVSDRLRDHIKR